MRASLALLLLPALLPAQQRYPEATWQRFASPAAAGFDVAKLERAKQLAKRAGSAALLVIRDGAAVVAWGDVHRRFMCHSVRKSFLSAMFGLYDIDFTKTLGELGIDDLQPLSDEEKKATIQDLLCARSGVYHPAAYEPRSMKDNRPKRGSHAPGARWFYNNWDFNTLLTIFEQETGSKFFENFAAKIARPIGMEQFRLLDTYYHYEPQSKHPAYPFRMSSLDMARFGLLFARGGRWNDEQLVPAEWIEESTRPYSKTGRGGDRAGYGYMWWVLGKPLSRHRAFQALGTGGQCIAVLPELDMVVVHRGNTFANKRVPSRQRNAILQACVDAVSGEPTANAELVALDAPKREQRALSDAELDACVGTYPCLAMKPLRVSRRERQLVVATQYGTFRLLPRKGSGFVVEDVEVAAVFRDTESGRRLLIEPLTLRDASTALAAGQRQQAVELLELAVECFPESKTARTLLERAKQQK